MLQGDKDMFLGFVLPTINFLKLKLENLKPQLKMCVPLANALIIGLEKRFQPLFDDDFHLLATITHPEFKDMDDERFNFDTETKVKAKTLFVNELQKVIPNDEKNMQETNCDQKVEIHGFFLDKKNLYFLLTHSVLIHSCG